LVLNQDQDQETKTVSRLSRCKTQSQDLTSPVGNQDTKNYLKAVSGASIRVLQDDDQDSNHETETKELMFVSSWFE